MATKGPTVKYLSLKQVAQKLGVSGATVVRWIETGKVKGVKKKYNVSGHLVFTVADLEKLKAHKQSLKSR